MTIVTDEASTLQQRMGDACFPNNKGDKTRLTDMPYLPKCKKTFFLKFCVVFKLTYQALNWTVPQSYVQPNQGVHCQIVVCQQKREDSMTKG